MVSGFNLYLPVFDGIVAIIIDVKKDEKKPRLNSVSHPGRSVIYNDNEPCSEHSNNEQPDNSHNKVEVFCEKLRTRPNLINQDV